MTGLKTYTKPFFVLPGLHANLKRLLSEVPIKSSPILVTCNFDYTVRHLKAYLEKESLDCFLLVVNTQGTNVWCAAAEGVFTSETVLSHLKVYNVAEQVNHKQLILPQLSVAGVKRKDT